MPEYLVRFAQTKEPFRVPELESICTMFSIALGYVPDAYNPESPYMVVTLPDDQAALKILSRAILIK